MIHQAGSAVFWKGVQLGGVKAIFLIRILILARLLAPEDFGLMAVSLVAIDFLMSVTDFGMVPALIQHAHPSDRHYHSAWTIGVIRALGITAVVFLAAPAVAGFLTEPRAAALIRALAFRPLVLALASVKLVELHRNLRLRPLAFVELADALLNTVAAVVLAPYLGVWALVFGVLLGAGARVVVSFLLAPYRPRILISAVATRPLIRYGRWIFLNGLVAVAGSAVLRVVISRQLGVAELGLYFLASRLAFLPIDAASDILGGVTFPLYARFQSQTERLRQIFQSALKGTSLVLFPACTLLIVLAPSFVNNVLGPRWQGTVDLIRLLGCINLIGLFGELVVPVLKGCGQPQRVMVLEGLQSAVLIILVWGLTHFFGLVGAASAWIPAIASSQIVSTIFIRRLIPHPCAGIGGAISAIAACSVLGGVAAFGVDRLIPGLVGLVVAALLGGGVSFLVLWFFDRKSKSSLLRDATLAFPMISRLPRPTRVGDELCPD